MTYSSKNRRTHGLSKLGSVMAYLLHGVLLKTLSGLAQQLGRHAEIDLRVPETHVPQINRKMWKQLLHVGPLPIPGREAVNSEGVTEVMQSRLITRTIATADPGPLAQVSIGCPQPVSLYATTITLGKERGSRSGGRRLRCVLSQNATQFWPDREKTCLAELRLMNGEQGSLQVHVAALERKGLPDT